MTPSARLAAVIDLVAEILASPRPADGVANAFVRARRYMGSKDRRAVTAEAWSLLRHRARLDWHLEARGLAPPPAPRPAARALTLAHRLMVEGVGAEALRALLATEDRHGPGRATERDQALITALAGQPLEDPALPPAARMELPEWLRTRLAPLGDAALLALLEEAPLDLRVNRLKAQDRDSLRALLAEEGIETDPGPLSPWALRAAGRPNIAQTRAFRDGLVEVQDAGSQMIALLADARPGMAVLDLCAGAGGKTLALAAAMDNRGSLIATDVSPGRLDRARERLSRAGAHNVTRRALDGAGAKWLKRRAGSFDRVLVDAPCSGTGTFRRNPDARWRLSRETLAHLVEEQRALLDRAAGLVRPGGRLIYATCSLLPEENGAQITAFLERHGDAFRPLAPENAWSRTLGPWPCDETTAMEDGTPPSLTLTPDRHDTDGFFVAVLERQTPAPSTETDPGDDAG